MSAPGTLEHVPADVIEVARATMVVLGASDADAGRAAADIEAVRDTMRLLPLHAPIRALVRARITDPTGTVARLLDPQDSTSGKELDNVLADIHARGNAARRAERANRRGTATDRRIARLEAELAQARREVEGAQANAQHLLARVETLTASNAELVEALEDAESRSQAHRDAAASARAALSTPRVTARHLLSALEADTALLEQAAIVVPEQVEREHVVEWVRSVLSELADPRAGRAAASARAMSVRMLGGGVEVGGSCALVTAGSTRILVDAGTRPNVTAFAQMAPPGLAAALAEGPVDAIVVTHAHADHGGWVPAVVAQCPGVPVYATAQTADLLGTMWADSARIYSRTLNGGGPVPYGDEEVSTALAAVDPLLLGQATQVGDVRIELFPAGHVVGAAGVLLDDGETRVVVSGDVSGPGQLSVAGWELPAPAHRPDLLVLESTYGAAGALASRDAVVTEFLRDIELTVSAGGRVLVPAFALGRAQEVAMLIARHLPNVPVRVDGMARAVTDVFEKHTGADGRLMAIWSDQVRPVRRAGTYSEVDRFTSGVIITTSGMLAAGPALTWARAVLPEAKSLLAVVGYQDPNSPGGRLLTLSGSGDTWRLPNSKGGFDRVEVNATVRKYGLGAHASSDELVRIATGVQATTTMLVHGDPGARSALGERLEARNLDVVRADTPWTAPAALL